MPCRGKWEEANEPVNISTININRFSPGVENEQTDDAGRDGRTYLEISNSQARMWTWKISISLFS